jgi:4-hydroxysphinganine ceramide fatty acyl 2-hydroxylase
MEYLAIRDIKPKHEGSKKMFENPLLNKLTRSHISIPVSMLIFFAAAFLYYGLRNDMISGKQIAILLPVGLIAFSLLEYLMHRYLYHMVPSNKIKGWIQYNMHGVHHEYPKDKRRLAMPPFMIIVAVALFLSVSWVLMGKAALAFTPGLLLGYASYLGVHYIVHAFQPPDNFLKDLWINHSIHHYKDPDAAFGVSSPLWDYVFGTIPKRKQRNG